MGRAMFFILAFSFMPLVSVAQEQEETRVERGFNLRYVFSYNYRILHNTITLGYNAGNHQLYIGPGHVAILPAFGSPSKEYISHTFAGTAGYRNYFLTAPADIRLFGQFQFSFYPVNYSIPLLQVEKSTDFHLENTLSIGGEYRLPRNYQLNFGFGVGSTDGIFLVRSSFLVLGFVGIQYHLYDLPKIRKEREQ